MSNPNSPEARKLAKELSDLRKLQKASHIAPRLPYSSVPEGNLVVTDSEGNVVDVVGPKGNPESGDQLVLPGPPPSKPSVPILTAYLGTITATWDGAYTEDYVAPDLLRVEVHSSTDDDFESSAGTLVGTISGQRGGSVTLAVEYGTHYVRFVAVSTSGSRSVESDIASVEVTPLVETIEMSEVLDDIDQRFGGVITEAGKLGTRLEQAAQDLAAHEQRLADAEADLTNLNTVELVQLKASVDQAKLDLTQAQTDVANALAGLELTETDLANLKNVTLPALQGDISNAQNRLSTAEGDITSSKGRLDEAESDLTDAFGQITAVDTKAGNAQTAASNAQTAADSANTAAANAAGIAGSKGKVLVQSTAPAVADRNAVTLWIDTTGGANTPKRWTSGTTWVAVTDKAATDAAQAAVTAQSRADSAHTAAGNAQTTADSALSMAGSKNKVFYSTSNPSGTASVGDTWRKVNASNDVIAEWRWTAGNTWLTQQITSEVISNLDVGKLTAGSAIINTAVVNKIAIQTADVIKLNASAITAGTISADRLNVNDLAAKIATVIQLNADRITAGSIATGRLNATEVAAAVATVIQLNASRITAGTISTDRLNATEIAAKVATVIQLNASRITAGTINTDRLNANEIAAKTAAFQTVDVKNLFATTGTMSEAVITKLWTDVVQSKKITSNMIAVGDFSNYSILDPATNSNVTEPSGWVTTTEGNYTKNDGSAIYLMFRNREGPVPFNSGDKVRIAFNAKTTTGTASAIPTIWTYSSTGTNTGAFTNGSVSISTTEKSFEVILSLNTVATNAAQWVVGISASSGAPNVRVRNVRVQRMEAGELIVDGAITAEKIKTNAVESDKIKANAITADKIDVGAIKAEHISAREITADKLRIGQGSNVFPDPLMQDSVGWNAASTLTAYTGGYGSSNRVRITAGTGQTGGYYGNGADNVRRFPVIPGRSYVVSVWVRPTVNIGIDGVIALYMRLVKDTGTGFVWPSPSAVSNNFVTTGYGLDPKTNVRAEPIPASTWVRMEGIISIPADTENTYIIPGLYLNASFPTGSSCDFSNLNVTEAVTGELIVEGSITTDKLKAGAITADKLDADAITGKTITGGSINGATLSLTRNRYEVNIGYDSDGAYLGFQTPQAVGTRATIRAHEVPQSDLPAQLVIKAPLFMNESERSFLSLNSEAYYIQGSGPSHATLLTNSDLGFTRNAVIQAKDSLLMQSTSSLPGVGLTDLKLSSDTSQGGYVQSKTTYARTYSGSAAMCITGSGVFGRTISALKYKQDVETVNPEDYGDLLLSIDHKSWIDKSEAKRYSDYVEWEQEHPNQPIPEEMMEYPTKEPSRYYGAIADDFHNAGLSQYVHYDANGEVDGLAYDRIGVALIPLVREQRDKIADLESRLATLEALVLPKEQ